MSDERTLAERYMTARTTSSMKVQERTTMSASDILAAAGMAGQKHELALALWNLQHQPTNRKFLSASRVLAGKLAFHLSAKRMKGKPSEIARQVLAWWLNSACPVCTGTGSERIPGTPHLSGVACQSCNGTGRTPLKTGNNEAATWLYAEISAIAASAESAIRRRVK